VQKIDTGRVYAMKTLHKAEMLKRDQVWPYFFAFRDSIIQDAFARSSGMFAQSAMSLPSRRHRGSCSCTTRSKIPSTYI